MKLMTILFAAAAMDLAAYMTEFAHGISSPHTHSQEAEPPFRVGLAYTSACGPACHPDLYDVQTFYLQGNNVGVKEESLQSATSCPQQMCQTNLIPDGLTIALDQHTPHRMISQRRPAEWDGSVNSGWLLEH